MSRCSLRPALVLAVLAVLVSLPVQAQPDDDPCVPPGRKVVADDLVELSFLRKPIDEGVLTFIADTTGKLVMPVGNLLTKVKPKITLMTGAPIARGQALDMIFQSFLVQGVGVIEKDDVIIIGAIGELMALKRVPVIDAATDIMNRDDKNSLVIKVYRLENVAVAGIAEHLNEQLPGGTQMTVDAASNQLVLCGDIAACQQVQMLIDELDHDHRRVVMHTFALEYANAEQITLQIEELFRPDDASTSSAARIRTMRNRANADRASAAPPGAEIALRLAVDIQQNSVTVLADPETMQQIEHLVKYAWDLPRPVGTSKVYVLEHTDPHKMRNIIREVLGVGSGSGSTRRPGAGGNDTVVSGVSDVYRFEAFADKNALVAICKTEQAFDFLDDLIAKLDQASSIGLPIKISLRHADAGRLAEEINALLAQGSASLRLAEQGLRAGGLGQYLGSGSGSGGGFGGGGGGSGGDINGGAGTASEISLPWESSEPGDLKATRAPESKLIGHVRVVPILRENALAVIAPPAHLTAMRDLIESFDQPSKQVMISVVIAEVELTSDLALGLRVASGDLPLTTGENALTASLTASAQENGFLGRLFETSVLDASFNVSAAIQALAGTTQVRVLHEPRVFTADNHEAFFFDGQQVPFIADSNNFEQGVNQTFDYRPVGLLLDVRPHITARRDVNLEVNIEMSSVVPGQTLFGGFVLDQRQARTNVTLSDGQTVVLSGLLREEDIEIERRVPLLGDIPLLGALFKSRESSTKTTEMLIFLTPHVLENTSATADHSRGDIERLDEMREALER